MAISFFVVAVLIVVLGAVATLAWLNWRDRSRADSCWAEIEDTRTCGPSHYDPAMLIGLPDIARRYFERSIEPGTPLTTTVRLQMHGTFILNGKSLPMLGWQILSPPRNGFVWKARIGTGLMRFAGSDGYVGAPGRVRSSWTKFWLLGLVPLARAGGTPDHAKASETRLMLESVWVPASLLPVFGAVWTQTGSDSATVRFPFVDNVAPMQIDFDAAGDIRQCQAMRWTDANPQRVFRLQPFGGRVLMTEQVGGFRIPVEMEIGNMFGTEDYVPFFNVSLDTVEYR